MRLQKDSTEDFMDFEHMLRQFFGDKEYHSQDARQQPKLVKQKLQKVIAKLEKEVLELDTTERHTSRMLSVIEKLKKDLKTKEPDYLTITIHLLTLMSRFFGFDYEKFRLNTPAFYQTEGQYYSQVIREGGDLMQRYNDGPNILLEQKKVVDMLKEQGFPRIRIAQILNTTEYKIKKIEKEL